jgi:hypothetical protein
MRTRGFWGGAVVLFLFVFLVGCAGTPVREAVKVDMKLPVGAVEGNQFTGARYPFKVSAPPDWKISLDPPKFMVDLGYEKEGLLESEVFIFNPATQSNIQFDLTPAGRYATFNQKFLEEMVSGITEDFTDELKKDYGKDLQVAIGPTEPVTLKNVPYAAKKYGTYSVRGVQREQGWIYGFAEPYQMFILYMIIEKEGTKDREAIRQILNSFEYLPPPAK